LIKLFSIKNLKSKKKKKRNGCRIVIIYIEIEYIKTMISDSRNEYPGFVKCLYD
jgi:hypothetical protein